jgi:hypothetical protein
MTRYAKTNVPGHPAIIVGKAYELIGPEKTKQGGEVAVIEVEDGQRIIGTLGHDRDTWIECDQEGGAL